MKFSLAYHNRLLFTQCCVSIGCALLLGILSYLLAFFCSATYLEVDGFIFFNHMNLLPMMVLTALCGELAAVTMTFLLFIVVTLVSMDISLVLFVGLATVIISYFPIKKGWYKSKAKALLFVPLAAIGIGLSITLTEAILNERGLRNMLFHIIGMIPIATIYSVGCYLFFNYMPQRIQRYFYCSIFYSTDPNLQTHLDIFETSTSRLSKKVIRIIIYEALLLSTAGAVFANFLFAKQNNLADTEVGRFFISKENLFFDAKLILLLMIFSVPVILFVNLYAQLAITRPIRLMAKAMNDFSNDTVKEEQHSVLDINLLRIDTKDEITDLYTSLKRTVWQVTQYIARLQEEQQLKEDLRIAQAASKAKSDFLSNMSHEIRTPINAVLGLDEMILRESTEQDIQGYAADIKSAGRSLLALINDILDFSKIESGKMEIIPVEYELSSTINDLINMTAPRAKGKDLRFTVSIAEDIPHLLFGDEVRIKQCILNILTNAVKYTKEGSVTMSMSCQKADADSILLTVHVQDTGIGIKQEDIPKLFHAFERIEEERNRSIEGTGLGMNIVQQLLTMMGSRLEVQSEYGKGSDFFFSVRQTVRNWEPIGNFATMYEKTLQDNTRYREAFHAPNARILVVDDTKLNLTVVKGLLKQTQIQIDTAENGLKTLQLVQEQKYDIIFLDHRMPDMDGIETLHAMQALDVNKNKGVPCIALTANAISGARELYLREGFTDYLTKPIESAKLEKMILTYLPPQLVTRFVPASEEQPADSPRAEAFRTLRGIDARQAIAHCGGQDLALDVIKEFYLAIDGKADAIESYAEQNDFHNYTVLVHALKSSARLIGAQKLSDDAAYLEQCGNRQDEAEIRAKTPALLALYRSYKEQLQGIAPAQADAQDLPALEQADYQKALKDLKECVQAFDFNTADSIITLLDGYRLPPEEQESYRLIREKEHAVDRDALLDLL